MTIITKIPGITFTDATLPKLYRDTAITAGTKFLFDSLDTFSFPKQASPIAGADVWADLTPNAANASFSAGNVFGLGGFTFEPVAAQKISLPASGKSGANAAGFLFGIWIKHLAASATAFSGVTGMCDSTTASGNQYSLDTGPAGSGNYRMTVMGNTGHIFSPAVGSIQQFVFGAKKLGNGTYDNYFWRNGVLVANSNPGAIAIGVPAASVPAIGILGGFGGGANFRAFRAFHDDLSTLSDLPAMTALALKDYNANVGRFS